MSKEKLVAIIVPCVIAIIVVIVITTHLPQNTKKPEQTAVSAYNLSEQLFDPQLTSLQRDTLWKEYEGKQVKWTSELKEVVSGKGGAVARFLNPFDSARTEVEAVFDESQSSNLSQCKEGDLVIYTGILSSLGEDEISLTDCGFVSLAIVPLWWNKDIDTSNKQILVGDEVVCLGPRENYDLAYISPKITAINKETGELLWEFRQTLRDYWVGIDSQHVYVSYRDSASTYIVALNIVSGQIDWTLSPDWQMQDIINKIGPGLVFPAMKPTLSKLTYEYEGVIYESASDSYGGVFSGGHCALQTIDPRTDDVLWIQTFGYTGMTDFSVVDGILYVSTNNGVGAFRLPSVTNP